MLVTQIGFELFFAAPESENSLDTRQLIALPMLVKTGDSLIGTPKLGGRLH